MKPVKRKYKISDGTLIQTSDDIISSATRDAVELAPYGITAVSMTMIAGLRTAFNDTPTDNEPMGNSLQIYFSTNPTDYPNGFQQPIGDGNTGDFVAGAIGFAEGVRERLMLYNPGPNLLTYKVVVEA